MPLNESSKVNLSPSTLPFVMAMGSLPATCTVPVSVAPSCLKVNVICMLVPSGVVAAPDHEPVTSAAIAVAALNVIANPAQIEINFLIVSSRPSSRPTHHTEQM